MDAFRGHGPLSSKQRQAVELIFTTADMLLLTGYPGTGKSSVVACIQEVCGKRGWTYAVMAPTGKAANRLGEGATTVHRALEATIGARGEFKFGRGPKTPLPYDLIILDEASMLDASLAYNLFRAIDPQRTRVLVIGDPDQLPPVDAGSFLTAMLESSVVPAVRLTRIFRQDKQSDICKLARAITRGSLPAPAELRAMTGVSWVEGLSRHTDVHAKLVELYRSHNQQLQILIPAKRGGHGTQEVNVAFHNALFSSEFVVGRFVAGDKIVVVKNCYVRDADGKVIPEKSVFNGETGVYQGAVCSGNKTTLHNVDFGRADDGREKITPLEMDAIELGYALTVHKSQGSEYEAMALVLHPSHGLALNRQLLYTAITRAKGQLYVLATYECMARCAASPCTKRVSLMSEMVAASDV
jgi:exodeoxyribonuclease V alpha subunit